MSNDTLEKQEQILKLRKKVLQAEQERLDNAPTLDISQARKRLYLGRSKMTQVNMLEPQTDLSNLVKLLETRQEEIIYLERNGTAVAQITLVQTEPIQKRIGVAEGKFRVPDAFDEWDKEIEDMFEGDV